MGVVNNSNRDMVGADIYVVDNVVYMVTITTIHDMYSVQL